MTKTWELVVIEQGYEEELISTGDLKRLQSLRSDLLADYEEPDGCQTHEVAPDYLIREV